MTNAENYNIRTRQLQFLSVTDQCNYLSTSSSLLRYETF